MLNVISRAWSRPETGSVYKVARNLVAGLEELEIPFALNRKIDYCSRLWIHDDYRAVMQLPRKNVGLKPLVGPNMFVMPRDIPWLVNIPHYCVMLQPSEWVVRGWQSMGYKLTNIDHWPVGIDSRGFDKYLQPQKDKVILYYKSRDKPGEVGAHNIENALRKKGIDFVRINCGSYRQEDYLETLGRAKYVIWYGCQESQGLALQEALAMGCPVIVIDVQKIADGDGSGYRFTDEEKMIPATSAPYFDHRCGVRILSADDLPKAIHAIESGQAGFDPRGFIAEKLSLKVSAQNLLSKFEKWWLDTPDFENGRKNKELSPPYYWPLAAAELRLRIRGIKDFLK